MSLVLCATAGAFLLAACTKAPPPDPWELASADEPRAPCEDVDDAFVFPVPEPERAAAIARLAETETVRLSEAEAVAIAGIRRDATGERLARQLLRKEIARLNEQRRAAYHDHVGGWSLADQERLDGLVVYARKKDADTLDPFLVRAIAKHEFTGHFVASVCGDVLSIGHGSLGRSTPPSTRLPVVVFLRKPPKKVHISWDIAE